MSEAITLYELIDKDGRVDSRKFESAYPRRITKDIMMPDKSTTKAYWWPVIKAEVLKKELEELASNFEDAGPDATWTGQEIADNIRDLIKNHPGIQKTGDGCEKTNCR